jgi:site-specific DNA-methyltransferase (adenine-specific)
MQEFYKNEHGVLYQGDCLEVMEMLEIFGDEVDMVLCDPPYGTTACKWDSVIDLPSMWERLRGVTGPNTPIVLTASQPFTTVLVGSNLDSFKYEWIWEKNRGSNFATLKYQPMKEHESVLVFSEKTHKYNPIKEPRKGAGLARVQYKFKPSNTGKRDTLNDLELTDDKTKERQEDLRYPSSIQKFNCEVGLHPTQKPVGLFGYLISTYTDIGDTVLDFTAGSGTTAVAAQETGRKWILIEKEAKYCEIIAKRLDSLKNQATDI